MGRRLRLALPLLVAASLLLACQPPGGSSTDGAGQHGSSEGEGEGGGEALLACEPLIEGATQIVEGDVLDVVVRCATGKVVDFEAPAILLAPAGLTLDPDHHVRWPTDLDDATVFDLEVQDPETRETVRLHVAVADAFGVEGNVPVVDPASYTEEFGVPVLMLSRLPDAEAYVDVDIVADGHVYVGQTKLRGASSLGYPKRSFTLKFNRDDRFHLPARAGQTSADSFIDKKKVVLTTTFDDSSSVRQRLAYQLWNRTSAGLAHQHVQILSTSVVVYVGSDYLGLYTMSDHVDRDLFEESLGLHDDGQLYKSISHDANFRNVDDPGAGFERRDEPDVDAVVPYSDLAELIAVANSAATDSFAQSISPLIDVDDVQAWWVFATAILGEDSYGKNAYLYRPATTNDGSVPRFRFAPWDFNHAFGQAWETSRTASDVPVDRGWPMETNLLWQRLLEDPVAGVAMRAAYADALRQSLREDDVIALYEAMVAETERAARRDAAVWADDYVGYYGRTDAAYDDEVQLVRSWIAARWAYLRAVFPEHQSE